MIEAGTVHLNVRSARHPTPGQPRLVATGQSRATAARSPNPKRKSPYAAERPAAASETSNQLLRRPLARWQRRHRRAAAAARLLRQAGKAQRAADGSRSTTPLLRPGDQSPRTWLGGTCSHCGREAGRQAKDRPRCPVHGRQAGCAPRRARTAWRGGWCDTTSHALRSSELRPHCGRNTGPQSGRQPAAPRARHPATVAGSQSVSGRWYMSSMLLPGSVSQTVKAVKGIVGRGIGSSQWLVGQPGAVVWFTFAIADPFDDVGEV